MSGCTCEPGTSLRQPHPPWACEMGPSGWEEDLEIQEHLDRVEAEGQTGVCMDYPDCDLPHAGGMGGVPVHPPVGARISGDEPLIPDDALPYTGP